ncbi:MAG: hypothetical protein U1E66_10275 [Rhodospirillales bacterium]
MRWLADRGPCAAVVAGCGLLGLAAAPNAGAAEWYLESDLNQYLGYENNIGLESSGGDQVSGFNSTSSIGVVAGGRTPVADVSLSSLFNFTAYPTQSELNSNDQYITLSGKRQGERWTAALTGQYIRDTTRTSDLEDTGGLILANKRREFYSIGPSFSYLVAPTHQVNLGAFYNYNHYDTKEIPDSANLGGQVGWTHDLTTRTQALATVYAAKINSNDNEQGNDNSRYYTLLLGASHKFSENLQGTLAVGPNFADTDVVQTQDGARRSDSQFHTGYSFDATLTYALEELIQLQGDVFRALVASSSTGSLTENTGVRLAASYRLLPHLSVELPFAYVHREQVGEGREIDQDQSRDYLSAEPTLLWQLTADWDFRLGYGIQWQMTDEGNGVGNSVFGFLTYRLPRLAMSR